MSIADNGISCNIAGLQFNGAAKNTDCRIYYNIPFIKDPQGGRVQHQKRYLTLKNPTEEQTNARTLMTSENV